MLSGQPRHSMIRLKVRCIAITGLTKTKGPACDGKVDAPLPDCSFGPPSAKLNRIADDVIIFSES